MPRALPVGGRAARDRDEAGRAAANPNPNVTPNPISPLYLLTLTRTPTLYLRISPRFSVSLPGELLLVDEISLAEDSVLERLNSVLDPARSLVSARARVWSSG